MIKKDRINIYIRKKIDEYVFNLKFIYERYLDTKCIELYQKYDFQRRKYDEEIENLFIHNEKEWKKAIDYYWEQVIKMEHKVNS